MPSINLRRALYDEVVRQGEDPAEVANETVAKYLQEEHDVEVEA